MSDTDSFINEVAEEVRRDKLYGYLRKYGWIAVLAVLVLVGGTAINEYRKATAQAQAEATGDALLAALQLEDEAARVSAIAEVEADGPAAVIAALLTATTQQEAGDIEGARATLEALGTSGDTPDAYRDLALIKAALLPSDDTATQLQTLDQLAQPGQPFRLLALEQMVYIHLEQGATEEAITTLTTIVEDAGVTPGLQRRAQTLMVALGEPLPTPQTEPETE